MPVLIYRDDPTEEEVAYFASNTWKLSKLVPALVRWIDKNASKLKRGKYVVNMDFIGNEKAELDDCWLIPRKTLEVMAKLGMAMSLNESPNIGGVRDGAEFSQSPIRAPLRSLLNSLDRISTKSPEPGDTAVRERVSEVIYSRFVSLRDSGSLPDHYGLFSPQADQKLGSALKKFLHHPKVIAAMKTLKTPSDRLAAFQDVSATSSDGSTYDEYFGHKESARTKKAAQPASRGNR